jgi:uncharacterized protein (DUF2235 family)
MVELVRWGDRKSHKVSAPPSGVKYEPEIRVDTKLPKNLVLCLDGTGNEFGDSNSNVVKLYATLIQSERQVC